MNEQAMGMADQDISGLVSMIRQKSALVGKEDLFDHLDRSQGEMAEVDLAIMEANWSEGKCERILGRKPSEGLLNPFVDKFSVAIEAGAMTETQRQYEALQVVELIKLGAPISWDFAISKMNIQGKNELMANMKAAQQQQQQMQQRDFEQNQHNMQVENMTLLAKAESDKSLARERLSKILTDQAMAELDIAKAGHERTRSFLDLVIAAQEIKGNNISHVQQVADIMGTIDEIGRRDEVIEKSTAKV
jgi:hypothetical protein